MAVSHAAFIAIWPAGIALVLALSYIYWFFFVRDSSSSWKVTIECEVVGMNGKLPWYAGSIADHANQIRMRRITSAPYWASRSTFTPGQFSTMLRNGLLSDDG